ncbi:TPA: glycosyltransferase family 1 protein [Salmonella enterica]|nr:glycosyltransferase family 1 protein [Salmonella enterica]
MLLIYTGSYPDDKCGVGDYVYNLNQEIEKTHSICVVKLSLFELVCKIILNRKIIKLINIQYPSIGFATNKISAFKPHIAFIVAKLFCLKTSITLHEFSSLSKRAQYFLKIFNFADYIIFTTGYEKNIGDKALFNSEKTRLIPIASNIPSCRKKEKKFDLVHFGIISKGKGIEEFIWIIKELNNKNIKFRSALIGYVPDANNNYANLIMEQCTEQNCELLLNKSAAEISTLLAETDIAILPYPDGISERRGTALAAMNNHALVFSLRGRFSAEFEDIAILGNDKNDLLNKVLYYINNKASFAKINDSAYEYSEKRNWQSIAQLYIGLISDDSNK